MFRESRGQLSVLSLPLPSLAVRYMLIEYPRPKPRVWRVALIYVCVMVVIKFVRRRSFFCENMSGCDGTECDGSDAYTCTIQPFCLTCGSCSRRRRTLTTTAERWANETYFAVSSYAYDAVQVVNLVGVHKVTAYNSNEGAFASWFDYVICDVLLIVAILVHISASAKYLGRASATDHGAALATQSESTARRRTTTTSGRSR